MPSASSLHLQYRLVLYFSILCLQTMTWVPCVSSSYNPTLPFTKSVKPRIRLPKSGCREMPVSRTATVISFPVYLSPQYTCFLTRNKINSRLFYYPMRRTLLCCLWIHFVKISQTSKQRERFTNFLFMTVQSSQSVLSTSVQIKMV